MIGLTRPAHARNKPCVTRRLELTQPAPSTEGRGRSESGQVMVLFGLMLTVLLGLLAVAVDSGNLYLARRRVQSAADLAALSGAQHLFDGNVAAALADAQAYASRNGYPSATVVIPPTDGDHVGDSDFIEVSISQGTATFFAGVLGVPQVTVSARAVARAGRNSPPYALLALSTTSQPAISFSGSNAARIYSEKGVKTGIMSNSTMDPSIDQNATSGSVYVEGVVNAVGQISGNFDATEVLSGVPPQPDPLLGMPPPPFGTTRYSSPNSPKKLNIDASASKTFADYVGADNVYNCPGADTSTFCPGVYYGGVSIAGGSWKMMPGIYIMAGGGLQMSGGSLRGDGILIYNTIDPSKPTGAGSCGPLNFNANQPVVLSASHDPQYYVNGRPYGMNILFFQDRYNCTASQDAMGIQASGSQSFFGTIYIPTNGISINGGGASAVGNGQIIANTIAFGGGSVTAVNYDPDWAVIPPGSALAE